MPPGNPPGPSPPARGSQGNFHLRGTLNRPSATTWESTAEARIANVTDDAGDVLRISMQREKTDYKLEFKSLPKKDQARAYNNWKFTQQGKIIQKSMKQQRVLMLLVRKWVNLVAHNLLILTKCPSSMLLIVVILLLFYPPMSLHYGNGPKRCNQLFLP